MNFKKYCILYNPIAGNGQAASRAEKCAAWLREKDSSVECTLVDMTIAERYWEELADKEDIALVICGGDGTLNRFVNSIDGFDLKNEVYYIGSGTGNDFLRDIKGTATLDEPVRITDYIKDLPVCEIDGVRYKFINGIGYGIDGYCCEVGDKLRAEGKENINYTGIAIKGLLFHYNATSATITVDGNVHSFKKVWIAPTMIGRYYGGGMMPTPDQSRSDSEGKVSTLIFHGTGRLGTLMIFPSIFKGEHLKHTKATKVISGHDVTVEFDRPAPLQIDGETFLGVKKYRVLSPAALKKEKEAAFATEKA